MTPPNLMLLHRFRSAGHALSLLFAGGVLQLLLAVEPAGAAVASANIPLDGSLFAYLEKLGSYGLLASDFKGIRPLSRSEAARLLQEARQRYAQGGTPSPLVEELLAAAEQQVEREAGLQGGQTKAKDLDWQPLQSTRLRYVYLDGVPRSYERQVHDPGGDGVFGFGAGLRPDNPYPSPVQQRGSEGTPLFENNEGNRYGLGSNGELRFTSEAYAGRYAAALLEPLVIIQEDAGTASVRLNKGYLKLGSGALELEVGRDAAWFGPGYRGAITLTNNAKNFDLLKLSSPEPIELGSWGWLKYAVIGSRFDRTVSSGAERQPWFYGLKLAYKPMTSWEVGFNLGKQVGGAGVDNGFGHTVRGFVGGTNADNSNGLAGFDLRYRATWLRNTEFYGEFSGEDTAKFWPIVESYLAGIHLPNLTTDGRHEFRFEYFQGNQILYTNGTFPAGYIYHGMPIGHSQGGATQELFFRYQYWLSARSTLAVEYFNTRRGVVGTMPGQVEENKNAWRGFWRLPLHGEWSAELMYGWERCRNLNLVDGVRLSNQLLKVDVTYRY